MAILTVGPTSTFPTIAAAMAAAGTGDIISLEAGYGNETATVTVNDLSFDGGSTSTNINLQLATGMSAITLLGTAPINVLDGPDANRVVGNDGDNIISVSSGVDVVTAGNGTDRLIIDYSAATASITGTTVDVTDGGTHAVTFTGVENFTITTGSGNDTITVADGSNVVNTGGGDDTITAGNGPNIIDGGANNDTITVGAGVNTVVGGDGNDTIVAGDGGNTINGGNGDDGISTGIGDDVVIAGLGNDTILSSAGADVTTVNGGIDTVDSGSESDRLIVDFSSSTTNVNGGVTGGTLAGGYDGAFADVAGTSSVVFQATENFTVTTGSGNDVIATGDGGDVLDGGAGSDQLNAGGGADTLLIGLGSDQLDGGADTDTVIFSAARANYQVTDLGGGVLQSIDLRAGSPDGTDTLVNMEGFVFTDGTFDAVSILNHAPAIISDGGGASANVSVTENSTAVTTVAASDPDAGTTLGYSIVGGDDAAKFTINGSTGALSFVAAPDFETPADADHNNNYLVQVRASDGSSFDDQTITVTVTDVPGITVVGDAGDNTLSGTSESDTISGLGGNDTLNGLAGDDVLIGGAGADNLNGGPGFDYASYETATAGVTAWLANSAVNTGDAAGDIYFVEGLIGSNFNDTLIGDSAGNVLQGGDGNDVLDGAASNDLLLGGNGDDVLIGGAGGDNLNGGSNFDYASYETAGAGVTAWLANSAVNTGDAAGDVFLVEGLIGSNFADTLMGDSAGNVLQGLDGNDKLDGQGGNDLLLGGNGDDVLIGGAGGDNLTGGAGFDYASYQTAGAGVTANLANSAANSGEAVGDIYFVEGLIGSSSADTLIGDSGDNILIGGAGGDTLNGAGGFDYASYSTAGAGVIANLANSAANTGDAAGDIYFVEGLIGSNSADTLIGDSADNILVGGGGGDNLNGGGGFDYASYFNATAGVTANLANSAVNTGDAVGDLFFVEGLIGSNLGDTLIGDSFGNVLQGLDGNDRIDGAAGNDLLVGGAGLDVFVFRGGYGTDRVADFSAAQDQIELQNNLAVNFSDAMTHATQVGADVQFDFGTQTLILSNIQIAQLNSSNFLFVS